MDLGRTIGIILAVLLVLGAAVFVVFRYSLKADGLYRVKTAVGIDAAAPERHIVPEGFGGWAVLHFSVEGVPALAVDNGTLVVVYPASGRLETSTSATDDDVFLHREYFRQTAEGLVPLSRMGEIWGEYNMRVARDERGAVASRSCGFFVGTLSEFRHAGRPHPGVELPSLPEPSATEAPPG